MADENSRNESESPNVKTVGLLARFDGPLELIDACEKTREAGYTKFDAYSPFPVHGIDPAIGIKRSKLPFFILAVGLTGMCVGLGMQWYFNASESFVGMFSGYPFLISGKPQFSLPANIPVTFEVIVLSSAFAALLGMFALNKLPRLSNPLFGVKGFDRVTNDSFFICIENEDPKFNASSTTSELENWGATDVELVEHDQSDSALPKAIIYTLICIASLATVPPVLIFCAMNGTSDLPRYHVVPDMDRQEKFKPQTMGPSTDDGFYFFADGRAARPNVEGAIARGDLRENREYFEGIQAGAETAEVATIPTTLVSTQDAAAAPAGQDEAVDPNAPPEPNWVTKFPLTVDESLMKRGQERFNIYCTACHGYAGDGDGLVNQRALELAIQGKSAWTPAKSLHDPKVVPQPVGRIFSTITHGRATMGPYGDQIPVADRWAIVLYVKALQRSRTATTADMPGLNPRVIEQPTETTEATEE